MIKGIKFISGGQTGVDRAALDFAIIHNLPAGGYCPKGRKAEDGPIPDKYPLDEIDSASYEKRTEKNVKSSDGTLIFTLNGSYGKGTAKTIAFCKMYNVPYQICEILDLKEINKYCMLHEWLIRDHIKKINIAGDRESENPGIYQKTLEALHLLFNL